VTSTTTTTTKSAANGRGKVNPLDFAFTHGGRTYYLPPLKSIKVGITRAVRKLDPVDAMFTIIESVASADTMTALDDMDMDELSAVTVAWQKHSNVSLPE
jgi:hypothetical protein